jgi:hypothetical protein
MRNLLFLLAIVFLISCKQQKNTISNFEFYPSIPDSANLKANFVKERIESSRRYNLTELTSGTNDSLIIRFWPWEAFEFWSNMLEFKLDSNGWKGYHYCSYTIPNQDGRIFHISGHEHLGDSVFVVKQIVPRCGWDKFYDSLNFFQLTTLPTQKHIKNFHEIEYLDGYSYSFEIATRNSYRWINYGIPDSYQYKECQNITELVGMFIRQFGNDYYWPKITVKKVGVVDTKNPLHF